MKNNFKRIAAASAAAALLLTGCSESNPDSRKSDGSTKSGAVTLSNYGEVITPLDIKNKYESSDDDIMPLYNVEPTETFEFNFNFDAYDSDIDLYDFVSVHTDSECAEESSIYYTASMEVENGKTELTVAPMKPVLATDSQDKDYIYEDIDSWGNAPIYYIALHYDMESDKPVKLEQPTIIPFTVKNEANAPTIKGVVSSDGRFSLEWEPIEGAEKYIVYNLSDGNLATGKDNHAIDGAKYGYDCGMLSGTENDTPFYLLRQEETTECSFDGFSGPESHSIAEIEDMLTGKKSNSGQNFGVYGEYFVTAVVDGKESGLSNAVSTSELVLPFKITEESEIQGIYPTPADFPSEVEVLNIDGSTTMRKVNYERVHVDCYEYEWEEYDYTIEGTYIYGNVGFEEDVGEPPQSADSSTETGNVSPEDEVDKVPDSDVSTIITSDDSKDYNDTPLIDAQSDNTKDHVEEGNKDTVDNPEGAEIFADSPEEEWLALNLVNGESEISLEAFPSLQDPYTLTDVFYKVYYQNPYILGVTSFSYDYENLLFTVNYVYDKETIKAKQEEISRSADKIISETINDSMSDEEKRLALYSYLEENCEYDNEALEEAEKNGFTKTNDNKFEDSFNAYGILVNKKGVCQSYAYAYKLLCSNAGLDCIVITGNLNGNLPHAWNAVNIDGKWYQTDTTNNGKTTGIPYFLYNSDTDTAEMTGFISDKEFELDASLSQYETDDDSYEYYASHGLTADSIDKYDEILDKSLDGDGSVISVRYCAAMPAEEDVLNTVAEVFSRKGMEDKLTSLGFGCANSFIIIVIK